MPMFLAIEQDVENWCESMAAGINFNHATRQQVFEKVHNRWEGEGDSCWIESRPVCYCNNP